jgi:large subunit ribosomal protein L3
VKTVEKDGYAAVQLGFGEKKAKRLTRAEIGHLAKNGLPSMAALREFRVADAAGSEVGQKVDVSAFQVGQRVDVVGTSIGRGFQGVVKRHHFRGGKATHGCTTHDQPGSIGASAYPSRVIKGKRLPGRMGGGRITAKNLEVVAVDPEQNLLVVRGSVPGARSSLVLVTPAR